MAVPIPICERSSTPMSRVALITVFVIFVVNLGKAFGFLDIAAAKCSSSCSSNIIQIINIPEEIKVIDSSFFIQRNEEMFNAKRVGNTFATCNSFFNKQGVTIGRDRQWFVEPFEYQAFLCNGSSASSNIVYGIMKLMRYITAPNELRSGVSFFQTNRMHSESWLVSSDKFFSAKFDVPSCRSPQHNIEKTQNNIAKSKKPREKHQPKGISGYRIIVDSTKLTIAVFLVTMLGGGIGFVGFYILSGLEHWILGSVITIFGFYIAVCAGLGMHFPWLPLSNWWRWFL